jgi:hypothetical protein
MRPSDETFRCLTFSAQPPGNALEPRALCEALDAAPSWNEVLDTAEYHGLEALLAAHIRRADIQVPRPVDERLKARCLQIAHAAAVRARVVSEVLSALDRARIPVLVLKGAALAQLVYANPLLRPMRDVDLLVPEQDARRARTVIDLCGFSTSGVPVGRSHHHLPAMSRRVDGATVTIEVHTELFARTPFVTPLRYHALSGASQSFKWGGLTHQTLGPADMLWHVYAHAFVINVFWREVRLISVADLIHATESWLDVLDWDDVHRRYPRMVRALPRIHQLTRTPAVRPIATPFEWWGALHPDVIWPSEWWFGMRYGIRGPLDWMWYRCFGHPARLAAAGAAAVSRRVLTTSG